MSEPMRPPTVTNTWRLPCGPIDALHLTFDELVHTLLSQALWPVLACKE